MKVNVKKLRGVPGDMQLVLIRQTDFVTPEGEERSTKERVYRIEIKMEMSDGRSYVADVHVSKFAYKPAGPATGRFPVEDLEDLDYALRGLTINRDFDPKKDWKILNEIASTLVSAYARQYYSGNIADAELKNLVEEIEKVEA